MVPGSYLNSNSCFDDILRRSYQRLEWGSDGTYIAVILGWGGLGFGTSGLVAMSNKVRYDIAKE